MHEHAHLARYDDWLRMLQSTVTAFCGLHPAVHFISTRIDLEREAACDDRVVSQTGAADRYASCLANAADLARKRQPLSLEPILAPHVSQSRGALVTRVKTPARSSYQPRCASEMGQYGGERPCLFGGRRDLTGGAATRRRARRHDRRATDARGSGRPPDRVESARVRVTVTVAGRCSSFLVSRCAADQRGSCSRTQTWEPPWDRTLRGSRVLSFPSSHGRCRPLSRVLRHRRWNRIVRCLRHHSTRGRFPTRVTRGPGGR